MGVSVSLLFRHHDAVVPACQSSIFTAMKLIIIALCSALTLGLADTARCQTLDPKSLAARLCVKS